MTVDAFGVGRAGSMSCECGYQCALARIDIRRIASDRVDQWAKQKVIRSDQMAELILHERRTQNNSHHCREIDPGRGGTWQTKLLTQHPIPGFECPGRIVFVLFLNGGIEISQTVSLRFNYGEFGFS